MAGHDNVEEGHSPHPTAPGAGTISEPGASTPGSAEGGQGGDPGGAASACAGDPPLPAPKGFLIPLCPVSFPGKLFPISVLPRRDLD